MTTETTSLSSPEQMAAWALNYESDIDCRIRLQAVLPDADRFVSRLRELLDALQRVPTTEQRAELDAELEAARAAEEHNRKTLEAAQAAHRQAKMVLEQAEVARIRARKAMGPIPLMVNETYRPAIAILAADSELRERGFTPEGATVALPPDADYRNQA